MVLTSINLHPSVPTSSHVRAHSHRAKAKSWKKKRKAPKKIFAFEFTFLSVNRSLDFTNIDLYHTRWRYRKRKELGWKYCICTIDIKSDRHQRKNPTSLSSELWLWLDPQRYQNEVADKMSSVKLHICTRVKGSLEFSLNVFTEFSDKN